MEVAPTGPYGPLIETRVRVLSWNLWWRFGPWKARQAAIAHHLAAADADILCLQEVWDDGTANQAAGLAEALGFHHVYAAGRDIPDPETGAPVRFGNAVLSRWPITGSEPTPLPAPPDDEEHRLVLRADVDGPRGPIQVFCTHLHWRFDHSHLRQDEVRAIAHAVRAAPGRTFPAVLCGDFNADPTSDEIRMLTGRAAVPAPPVVFHDAWDVAGDGPGYSWSDTNPYAALDLEIDRRIDYVFAGWPKAGGAGHVVRAELAGVEPVEGVVASDHYGVLAELRY